MSNKQTSKAKPNPEKTAADKEAEAAKAAAAQPEKLPEDVAARLRAEEKSPAQEKEEALGEYEKISSEVEDILATAAEADRKDEVVLAHMKPTDGLTGLLAEKAFNAYGDEPGPHGPWKTFDGRPMPTWADLGAEGNASGPLTMTRWRAVVTATLQESGVGEIFDELARHGQEGETPVQTLRRLVSLGRMFAESVRPGFHFAAFAVLQVGDKPERYSVLLAEALPNGSISGGPRLEDVSWSECQEEMEKLVETRITPEPFRS